LQFFKKSGPSLCCKNHFFFRINDLLQDVMLFVFTIDQCKDFILTLIWIALAWGTWKFVIRKIDLTTYCLKIHGTTCELNFWSWDYHLMMGPIQNMEAMFQTWKMHSPKRKYMHLEATSSFYCECTLNTNN
jgi:hypothetical protein